MKPKRRAVVAVVRHKGKILMGKKKKGGKGVMAGKWHIPAEKLEPGETDEQAIVRGMMEEAGIKVKPGKYLGSIQMPGNSVSSWYECTPLTIDIIAGSDLEKVEWIPIEEVLIICQKRISSMWPKKALEYFKRK